MKLSEIKNLLTELETIVFQLPSKLFVPEHFHVTEVGIVTRKFIDCGGTVRESKAVNFQLWEARDFDHRLAPSKLLDIIELSEQTLGIDSELDIEVEYQSDTIGRYGLNYTDGFFQLTSTQTNCLAEDSCGIPVEKRPLPLVELVKENKAASCSPSSGSSCC
jgi:hypothetical protein